MLAVERHHPIGKVVRATIAGEEWWKKVKYAFEVRLEAIMEASVTNFA